jgi:hypothetical protein
MTRRFFIVVTLALTLFITAVPAYAQTPDEVADEVRTSGYYIEPGLDADAGRISNAVRTAANEGLRFFVVLLDEDPPGGAVTFAAAVLDHFEEGTVLVLSASDEGIDSFDFAADATSAALDAGFAASQTAPLGQGDEAFVEAVVEVLTGVPVTAAPSETATTGEVGATGSEAAAGGSKTGLIILVVVVAALILLVVWAVRRQRKSADKSQARAVEEARTEIKKQLDAMANVILEISDLVSASASKEDNRYLEEAGKTYTEAEESFGEATDLRRLEDLSDQLDEARWQLDAAAAIANGKPVPPKPKREERHACFFDPTHPGPFEDAQIETAAGTKTVRVCAADAEKLRRGQQPKPRMIEVGGRQVPAPAAPRSHGGGGFDWLDVFSVVVGGMGQARSYDWGGLGRASQTSSRRRSTSRAVPAAPRPSESRSGRARSGRTRRRRR